MGALAEKEVIAGYAFVFDACLAAFRRGRRGKRTSELDSRHGSIFLILNCKRISCRDFNIVDRLEVEHRARLGLARMFRTGNDNFFDLLLDRSFSNLEIKLASRLASAT